MSLPTFVLVGGPAAASLYSSVGQHPQVHVPAVEEPSWFAFARPASVTRLNLAQRPAP